ncbi:MAG: serine/threonine-protein kinase [Candidatus Eremiobacterota bacterium]
MSLEPGTILNNIYRVEKILGKGGMGNVYLVDREGKKFVVKELIFAEGTGFDDETAREIFFREAEFMAKFDHPGLPKTYGVFSQNGRDYITMDYIEGKTLEEIINASKVPLKEEKAIKWAIEIAGIIDYLHNSFHAPVIYRDLKPANIIVTPSGKIKLVDFGIARFFNPDKNTDTFRCGSPGYAAPEQYKGRGQSGTQTDVFGLGVILFQMLTKYDPTVKLFTFPPMKSLNSSVTPELERIITRSIQINPLKRYISMDEFREELRRYLGIAESYSESCYNSHTPVPPQQGSDLNIRTIAGIIIVVAILFTILFSGGQATPFIIALIIAFFIFYVIAFILYTLGTMLLSVITGKKYGYNNIIVIVLAIILMFTLPFLMAFLSASSGKKHGQLAACESNLKNIATALEMYATDNTGDYPHDLLYLTTLQPVGGYMKTIPMCPASRGNTFYLYTRADNPDNFTLWCSHPDAHEYAGLKTGWPQYTPGQGLKTKE